MEQLNHREITYTKDNIKFRLVIINRHIPTVDIYKEGVLFRADVYHVYKGNWFGIINAITSEAYRLFSDCGVRDYRAVPELT